MEGNRQKLRVLDLFSGIGGFSLGLHRAGGFETVAFCEIEPFCQRVLAKNFPGIQIFSDIKTLSEESINELSPSLICGGFPCQDLSVAGKGKGLSGERSGLWYEMLRVIRSGRPRWIVIENVPALRNRGSDEVLSGLEELSYSCWPCVVGAWATGLPHKRDRVWIVGKRLDNPAGAGREACGHQPIQYEPRLADRGGQQGSDGELAYPQSRVGSGIARVDDAGGALVGPVPRPVRRTCGGDSSEGGDKLGRDQVSGREGDLAHSARDGERSEPATEWSDRERIGQGGNAMLAYSTQQPKRESTDETEPVAVGRNARNESGGCGDDGGSELADPECRTSPRERKSPRMGWWKDGSGQHPPLAWPARPGEPQHAWEAPRLIEFPLGGSVDGVPVRLVRAANRSALKAYGNAVVPAIPELIGRWILAQEGATNGRE